MTNKGDDSARIKADQRRDWDSVAEGWERWWPVLEQGATPVSECLLRQGGVGRGQQVLDVATGIGEPALSAAQQVGAAGRVVATDQAPQMLAVAQARAAKLELTNVEWQIMDGETLVDIQGRFDVVLCRWGLMFFPAPEMALARMHALLKPGGRLALAVWGTPPEVPMISLAMATVRRQLDLPAPDPEAPGPFRLADPERLAVMLEQAGFQGLSWEDITVTFELPSTQAYTNFTRDVAAPIRGLVEPLPADQQEEIWQAVSAAVEPFASPDGSITMDNRAICISGARG